MSAHAFAQRSYFRLYDQNQGLSAGEIAALAQDDQGFLWVGAHRGLLRFDGREFVSWAPEQMDELVYELAYGPDDQLLARTASGQGLRRMARGFDAVPGPDGAALHDLMSFGFDARGSLWAVLGTQLWQRDAAQHWQQIALKIPASETPQRLRVLGDAVIVFTERAAWRLRAGGDAELLLRAHDLWFAAGGGTQPVWLATHFGKGLWRVDPDGPHALDRPDGRALDLRERGETMWLAMDRELLAFEPDGRTRRMGIAEGLPSGGPLLIDHDQSLWLGTFVGLLQFPQPDTWQWNEAEGLPSAHVYGIAQSDGTVWAQTWSGLAHLGADAGANFNVDFAASNYGRVCVAPPRGVWASDGQHLLTWRNNRFEVTNTLPSGTGLNSCALDAQGRLWLATTQGLMRLPADGSEPQPVALDGADAPDLIWADSDGTLRIADDAEICRLDLHGDSSASRADCVALASGGVVNSLAKIAPRNAWIATNIGIFAFDGASAERLPGNHLLQGGIISTLSAAAHDDWWAAGAGTLLRIRPCSDCAAGWNVSEAPGQWQGLPGNTAMQALETSDGNLWIAGNRGVWRVPSAARAGPQTAPVILPVHARIDGVEQAFDGALSIPPSAHRIDLEFAALSFRDRSLLRFRSRLSGQGGWSPPTRVPLLQFAALEPGDYRAEMAASLDGEHWSSPPATLAFGVLPPWYRTWWARLLMVAVGLAFAIWMYRLRVAALLRVERERTRIAMDLHDELGTGLGSIGMLAGVAAREGLDAGEQRRLVREIANVSSLLGSGLRSLVWSLRSGRAGLTELGAQIADHARRLFPEDQPRLYVQLPSDAPNTPLAAELRRHVLLLALETLHNIARHARAQNVVLALTADTHGGFCLRVEDDGLGFDPESTSAGSGLESIRRRAAAIRAKLDIASAPGSGTRITLTHSGRLGLA